MSDLPPGLSFFEPNDPDAAILTRELAAKVGATIGQTPEATASALKNAEIQVNQIAARYPQTEPVKKAAETYKTHLRLLAEHHARSQGKAEENSGRSNKSG